VLRKSTIRPATSPADFELIRILFEEYAASLGVELGFQQFEEEIASLPGKYSPPGGCILISWVGPEPAGCVAMRPWSEKDCEMKRLYIRDAFRGEGLGKQMIAEIVCRAAQAGYERMLLDTLPSMRTAQLLYRSFGFQEIEAYRPNPIPGTRYFALQRRPSRRKPPAAPARTPVSAKV
jgi:ribosomal protein S18 acetylase RimI-like enzyme